MLYTVIVKYKLESTVFQFWTKEDLDSFVYDVLDRYTGAEILVITSKLAQDQLLTA